MATCGDLGQWDDAMDSYHESLAILERLGDIYALSVARNNLGNICYRRGDWTRALENYRLSLEGFEKAGDAQSEASVLSNVASLCYKMGEWSEALESYQKSLDLFEKLDDWAGVAQVLGNLGNFYHRRGERNLALEHFQRGLEIQRRLRDREGAAEMQASIDMIKAGRESSLPASMITRSSFGELEAAGDLSGQAEVLAALAGSYSRPLPVGRAFPATKTAWSFWQDGGSPASPGDYLQYGPGP